VVGLKRVSKETGIRPDGYWSGWKLLRSCHGCSCKYCYKL